MTGLLSVIQTIGYLALAIVLLMIMITIHEFGHYITAKIMHFKIYEFSIGMGKPLFKKTKKNGEIFAIRMIPIGGYCSFGEDDATTPDTDPNAFNNKAPWQRLIVLFSGAFFNFVSAIIFAVLLLSLVGYGRVINVGTVFRNRDFENDPTVSETITLAEILNNEGQITGIDAFSEDMLIESINGQSMNLLPTNGANMILQKTNEGDTINLVVILADGNTANVTLTITERQWAALGNANYTLPPNDHVYHNVGGALLKAVPFSFEIADLVLRALWQMVTGQLGMKAIGGTVATVSVMGDAIGQALSGGALNAVVQISYLITLLSINLAVFNWLPIPSLDGARMVFVIIEWIRKKPIKRELEAKIHLIGIICLLAFVVFADIFWVFNNIGMHLTL